MAITFDISGPDGEWAGEATQAGPDLRWEVWLAHHSFSWPGTITQVQAEIARRLPGATFPAYTTPGVGVVLRAIATADTSDWPDGYHPLTVEAYGRDPLEVLLAFSSGGSAHVRLVRLDQVSEDAYVFSAAEQRDILDVIEGEGLARSIIQRIREDQS